MLLARGTSLGLRVDEEVLITGGGDGVVNMWHMDEKDEGRLHKLGTLEDGRDEGESVLSIVVDGSFLYAGRVDGEINVWDLETKQLVRILKAHSEDVLNITIGGGILFSAAVDGIVKASWSRATPTATHSRYFRNSTNATTASARGRLTKVGFSPRQPQRLVNA